MMISVYLKASLFGGNGKHNRNNVCLLGYYYIDRIASMTSWQGRLLHSWRGVGVDVRGEG